MHRLARFSLAQRSMVALATLVIVVAGVLSASSLKQELIPSLAIPQVAVTTSYPGAGPEVVDEQLGQPLSDALAGIDGLESVSSTSRSGVSQLRMAFDYDTDTEQAESDVREVVEGLTDLPADTTPEVFAGSSDDLPVLSLAISSDADLTQLSEDIETAVVPELEQLEGVREVTVGGAESQQVLITPDAEELATAGLTSQSITDALGANGTTVPAGTISEDGESLSVSAGSAIADLDDLRAIPLLPTASGDAADPTAGAPEPVALGDVAEVALQTPQRTSITRTNGAESLSVSVTKTPEGDSVGISGAVDELIPTLTDDLGEGAVIDVVFDQAPFIEQSIEDLTTEGALGLVFAIVVILIFLASARSTLVTAISIPMSLLVTLIGLSVAGYSLNILTLGALTIAIGRVVDDSIVVIENIKRHLSYGEDKREAVLTGVREVASAITSSTVATAAVFVPIAVVGGLVGVLFRPFALTVVVALVASLLVSLTIVPVLAFWFLKGPQGEVDPEAVRGRTEAKERGSALQRGYLPILSSTQRHPVRTLVAAVVLLGGTLALVPQIETDFLGSTGQNQLSVTQELPVGTDLAELSEAASQVETELLDVDGIETVQATIGTGADPAASFGLGGASPITFLVTTDAEGDQETIQAEASDALDRLSGVGDVTVGAASGGVGVSSDVEVVLEAEDESLLEDASADLSEDLSDVEGVDQISSDLAAAQPTLEVAVDRTAAADAGLTEAQVTGFVASVLSPRAVDSVVLDGTDLDIVIDSGEAPETAAALAELNLLTPTGEIPLSDVAEVSRVEVPQEISTSDGERVVTLTVTPEQGVAVGTLTEAVQAGVDEADLPEDVEASLGGVSEDQSESFAQLGLALLAAIGIVFLVMVATFRSLVQPFILLVSVPFAATGALAALLLTGTPLGIAALIGLLMLIGIVVTNAIVLIDLVNQYREQGQPVADAVVNGARQRLRPILMTALATIGALTPMALGLTGGSAFISQALAVVVIGGLISSTALTLILVPVIYGLVEGGRERRRARPAHSADTEADSRPWGHARMVPEDRSETLERENIALKRMVAEAELRQMALAESARRAILPGPAGEDQGPEPADGGEAGGGRPDDGDRS